MELKVAIEGRRSTRKFSTKKADWRNIIEAIHSTQYAPMAGSIFPFKFVIIDDQEIIKEVAKWSEQEFINQVKYVVAVVSDKDMVKVSFPKESEKFTHQETGAAIENFLLTLSDFGLSTCWIGHFNEEKIKKILKIPEEYEIEALFPIGYSSEKTKKAKPKSDIYNILYFNTWQHNRMRKVEKIESRAPEGY
jgi:nitroreductase